MPVDRLLASEEISRYASEIPGVIEQRRWALHDRIVVAGGAALVGDQTLFTVPIGQGVPAKTLTDTNMRSAGQLAARTAMLVYDIRVQIQSLVATDNALIANMNAIAEFIHEALYLGNFTFRNTNKVDLEVAPLTLLPAGYGVTAVTTYSGIVTGGGYVDQSNGHPSRAALWDLAPLPIVILPQRNFAVVVNFPAPGLIVPAAATSISVWVHLDGVLLRSA